MAMVMKIILMVIAVGCVAGQSTIDDDESPLDTGLLQLEITQLRQQHEQLVQVLRRILDRQQQQHTKLNELQVILADNNKCSGELVTQWRDKCTFNNFAGCKYMEQAPIFMLGLNRTFNFLQVSPLKC